MLADEVQVPGGRDLDALHLAVPGGLDTHDAPPLHLVVLQLERHMPPALSEAAHRPHPGSAGERHKLLGIVGVQELGVRDAVPCDAAILLGVVIQFPVGPINRPAVGHPVVDSPGEIGHDATGLVDVREVPDIPACRLRSPLVRARERCPLVLSGAHDLSPIIEQDLVHGQVPHGRLARHDSWLTQFVEHPIPDLDLAHRRPAVRSGQLLRQQCGLAHTVPSDNERLLILDDRL